MRNALLHPERPQMAPSSPSLGDHRPRPWASRTPFPQPNALPPSAASDPISDWVLDCRASTVRLTACDPETAVPLTECEFSLATALFYALGHPVSRSRLQACASLDGEIDSAPALDSRLGRLQRKLEAHRYIGVRLQTLHGHGYRLLRTAFAPGGSSMAS